MTQHDVTSDAGTPRVNHVYAVFDTVADAERAEQALVAQGFQPERLHPYRSAEAFEAPDASAGPLAKLERFVKRLGGETHDAERYASHLEQGRVVLGIPADTRDAAVQIADLLQRDDGYDVTYFSALAIEYMSPEANTRHGQPTHATSNLDSID